jgi:uncharacterized SAM-binding protein YcdF (DUF218 family)
VSTGVLRIMLPIEKALTTLAMPCGLLWLGMMALLCLAWRAKRRKLAVGLLLLVAGYTSAGNAWFGTALLSWLEKDYRAISPLAEGPFDAVIILGGGTDETPAGAPQLHTSGDRVMVGAQLYLSGRTQYVVCTGARIQNLSRNRRDASENTAILLRGLGVPEGHIIRARGRNTSEEIRAIREVLSQRKWRRVGLVTSAWHMARAMRLAGKAELDLQPLPADFRGTPPPWSLVYVVPNGGSFRDTSTACKEILARLIGR